jgi:anhydro-N-acetylmuramic acid kinase
MIKQECNVIGVMSGTSLDGLDIAYITFKYNLKWHFKIEYAETISYSRKWIETLQNLVFLSSGKLLKVDEDYTKYISIKINEFIKTNSIKNIDAVCSHGHTALHQPKKEITYQIGNRPEFAQLINRKVVCDFRVQDVELGGQGAPLVPIGDELLFSDYNFCLNLGGFANISFHEKEKRIAYDICPVNIVLNHYVNQLGFDYDDEGKISSIGMIHSNLLQQLNDLSFYKQTYPKSLGIEWVNEQIIPLIDSFQLQIKDILRTFIEHIAIQIATEINKKENATVLITGGGVYNLFLIERLESLTKNRIIIPSRAIIDYKEALIFGFLGVLKLRNEVNCLSSVTGAKHDHSSGEIYLP